MSIILALLGTMVLFVTPIAVELLVCMGLCGCGHPMSMRVWRWGTILPAAMNNAASSASAAKAMTNFDDSCNGLDCTIDTGNWVIFQKVDVCPSSALRFGFVEVACIRVRAEHHVASSIYNTIIGIHCHIV